MAISNYVVKAIGMGATALLVNDAASRGVRYGKKETANQTTNTLIDTFTMHQTAYTKYSPIKKAQKYYFKYLMGEGTLETLRCIKNCATNIVGEVVDSVVPIGLATAAMLTKTGSKIPGLKGFVPSKLGKLSVIALTAGAVLETGRKVFGIGRSDNLYDIT